MSTGKHTAGTWVAGHPGNGVRVESEHGHGVANDGWAIADFYGPDAVGNAALTAAGPDMLHALRELVWVIRIAGLAKLTRGVELGQTSWFVKASDRMEWADAAISRATGEAK